MILTIARQNLFHDKLRLGVTLTGVAFAVLLVTVQIGLFIGFTTTISAVIDHSGADMWIASRGVKNFDIAQPLKERLLYRARALPQVEETARFLIRFADWKKPDGGQESIQIIGYETAKGLGGPWGLVQGGAESLSLEGGIIMDQLYMRQLGISQLGQYVEINNRKARVVGFTRGIRSFTTSPYVFTTFENARTISRMEPDEMTYILLRLSPEVPADAVRQQVATLFPQHDVYTTPEFRKKTQLYWMFNTGAGTGMLIAAFLGLVVGTVVVAQTLYATTMDHLSEFATIKAMGAPDSFIYRIILAQALISAFFGYGFGMGISVILAAISGYTAMPILIPAELATGMFLLTVVMCVTSACVSINKVLHIDPAIVFRGR
ncbi:ABC transporter permease [Desulfovibrio psychrotolerans]|uniref:ABC transporter permease n=1 Tax=Desulfovibrio psychrotolerans TaxID=415242 RepID=A0A7J0BVX1_9BACT|nr:ABC transporter permease [Desulfovibrio psychrotolerans]GFM37321.1 ABC transporter permease [Desulfovibrio psychrotolerans]